MRIITVLFFFFVTISAHAAKVDTLVVESNSMNKAISNIVITPESYNRQKLSYPVLYLLHGAGGNYMDWLSKVPAIKNYVDQYNFIIVCPDGGLTSWYFDSPIDPSMKYETYVSKELVKAVDKQYKTQAHRRGRAITGLSMGGHGALYLAFRHPNIWGAAGSTSGGVDILSFPNGWDISKRLGDYEDSNALWEANSVSNMVHLLKKKSLKLIFDCGVDDFFFEVNQDLHKRLLDAKIPHDYIERPGGHNWKYWTNAIKFQLLFFDDFFRSKKTTEHNQDE